MPVHLSVDPSSRPPIMLQSLYGIYQIDHAKTPHPKSRKTELKQDRLSVFDIQLVVGKPHVKIQM